MTWLWRVLLGVVLAGIVLRGQVPASTSVSVVPDAVSGIFMALLVYVLVRREYGAPGSSVRGLPWWKAAPTVTGVPAVIVGAALVAWGATEFTSPSLVSLGSAFLLGGAAVLFLGFASAYLVARRRQPDVES